MFLAVSIPRAQVLGLHLVAGASSLGGQVSLLQQLEHENIIALLDYWESGDTVFVLLEYCPQGDLSQVTSACFRRLRSTEYL